MYGYIHVYIMNKNYCLKFYAISLGNSCSVLRTSLVVLKANPCNAYKLYRWKVQRGLWVEVVTAVSAAAAVISIVKLHDSTYSVPFSRLVFT